MSTDAELLHEFVTHRSETAFAALVHRYLGLVRTTALRRVGGDAHAADDVAQQVFVSLARNARSLRNHVTLAGWLYVSTHHATAEFVRREQRRKQREASAHSMHLLDSAAELPDDAAKLRPLLDDALISLKPDEREAIVLRFFSERSFAEIGQAVHLTEEAARKRVDRALEKLHAVLSRRGITSTVGALGLALTAAGVDSAPGGLALKITGAALTQTAAPSVMATLSGLMGPAAAVVALAGGIVASVVQHRANGRAFAAIELREQHADTAHTGLQTENQRLVRELANAARERPRRDMTIHPAAVRTVAPAAPLPGKAVSVSTTGTLTWEGESVTLDQFLINLLNYQRANAQSRLVVKANGARFQQLNWVLDEARKAGIANLTVESDAAPVGWMNTWF